MAFLFDDVAAGGQLFVGAGSPFALGIGEAKIRGSAFVEGPQITGNATEFPQVFGSLMVAPSQNEDTVVVPVPGSLCGINNSPYSLVVSGDAAIFDNLDVASNITVGNNIMAQGEVMSRCGGHILSAKKNFDIPHPTKDGWRLRHTCPEGPSNDVYYRGKIINKTEIDLPSYWEKLVDPESITVNLTPIGAHQNVIVKRIFDNRVYLQSNGGIPINCFFHIFATRADGEKLIPEYQGSSPADYPGDNNQYSISGYHYDVK